MKSTAFGNFFARRWQGQVPLAALLWRDMLGVGTLINIVATVLALAVMVQGAHPAVAVALHFAPLPYNVFLFAAVWRSPHRDVVTGTIAAVWLAAVTLI
ncbi:MAG: hypothetical protein Q8R61_05295 [Thiobacillus sp.]|uniref:hypothetical protein n=1 Tax=Thiobacillus sp. TaxID=924 RepID=UPI00273334F4|nr:hypothetical protein [Thiobacillus sp.]MDP3584518.1 hypothetical protein [Thiobacillus sp.]